MIDSNCEVQRENVASESNTSSHFSGDMTAGDRCQHPVPCLSVEENTICGPLAKKKKKKGHRPGPKKQ